MRNSWQRAAMDGIGLDCGRESSSPCCNWRSKNPASNRASGENGGVLTSPRNQMSGLSAINNKYMSDMIYYQMCAEIERAAQNEKLEIFLK